MSKDSGMNYHGLQKHLHNNPRIGGGSLGIAGADEKYYYIFLLISTSPALCLRGAHWDRMCVYTFIGLCVHVYEHLLQNCI